MFGDYNLSIVTTEESEHSELTQLIVQHTDRPTLNTDYRTLRLKVNGHWTATRTITRNRHNDKYVEHPTRLPI